MWRKLVVYNYLLKYSLSMCSIMGGGDDDDKLQGRWHADVACSHYRNGGLRAGSYF